MELFIQLLLIREPNSNHYQQSWVSTTGDFLNSLEIINDLCLCALAKTSVYTDIHI